jgi:PhnB protein
MADTKQTITVYITCKDAGRAIDFYKQAFGAVEELRLAEPSGRIGHAELRIGNSLLMLSDEYPEMEIKSPQTIGGTPAVISVEVDDADATVGRAVAAGARVIQPLSDQFYGYRSGKVADPFGHVWGVMTNKEHLSNDEIRRRFENLVKQPAGVV